jgi:hypothetical protein
MSQSAISRIWRAVGLKPHLARPGGCRVTPSSSTRFGRYLVGPDAGFVTGQVISVNGASNIG